MILSCILYYKRYCWDNWANLRGVWKLDRTNEWTSASLVAQTVKLSACNAGGVFNSWVGKFPGRKKWQSTPALLPGKSHGQRSLIGYSPWGRKESDTTEWLHFHFHFQWMNKFWRSDVNIVTLVYNTALYKLKLHRVDINCFHQK